MNRAAVCAFFLVVSLATATAAVAAPGDWYQAPRYGAYYLTDPCCSGDALNGTSSAIKVESISPDPDSCILFRSTAETESQLIQAGVARCGSNIALDGTCSSSNNLVKFVEILNGGVYTCYPHGAASARYIYNVSVQNASSTTWYAFINGTSYESLSMPAAVAIAESGEHTPSNSCSGWSASATYANSSAYPWQRFIKSSLTWFNVQSSYASAGCWTLTGGPPSPFTISH